MNQVHFAEKLYKKVKRRASEEGFSSVDDFVADIVRQKLEEGAGNLNHLFTPERIAHLDRISAKIKAGGKTYTMQEVEAHFDKKRKQWLENHAS
jgi:metal-responsive CopG/Arc/MetJ family transcriptional regulator